VLLLQAILNFLVVEIIVAGDFTKPCRFIILHKPHVNIDKLQDPMVETDRVSYFYSQAWFYGQVGYSKQAGHKG
jgi:hypothetical protein